MSASEPLFIFDENDSDFSNEELSVSIGDLQQGKVPEIVKQNEALIASVADQNVDLIECGRTGDRYQYLTLIDPVSLTPQPVIEQPPDALNRAMLRRVYEKVCWQDEQPVINTQQSEGIAERTIIRADVHDDRICEHLLLLEGKQSFRVSVVFPVRTWRPDNSARQA